MIEAGEFSKVWHNRQFKKSLGAVSDKSQKFENQTTVVEDDENLSTDVNLGEFDPQYQKIETKHLKTRRTAKKVLRHSGTLIFLLSLVSTIIILFPFFGIGTNKNAKRSNAEPTVAPVAETSEAKVIKEATAIGLDARFSIYVPKIDAKSVVVENVDLSKESEYLAALKKGVAHGKGTYFPGQGKNIFLFAHSVSSPDYVQRYNAVFYQLRNVEAGDDIIIYFSGDKYVYKVSEKIIASAKDVSFLTKDYGGETLILQTCDPPGTTLRRLLVIAKLKNTAGFNP